MFWPPQSTGEAGKKAPAQSLPFDRLRRNHIKTGPDVHATTTKYYYCHYQGLQRSFYDSLPLLPNANAMVQ